MSSSATSNKPNLRDNVSRIKGSSPQGTALFVGLRTADLLVQYSLIAHHAATPLLRALRIPTLPAPISGAVSVPTWVSLLALPLKARLLLGLALGSSIKQSFWAAFINEYELRVGDAIGVGLFNTILNSLNSIMSTISPIVAPLLTSMANSFLGWLGIVSPPNPDPNAVSPIFLLGCAMGVAGLVVETVSEIQRRAFKSRPENKGKLFTCGLFGVARHINYGAYTTWRAGYALAAGGPVWGALVFWFFFRDFVTRGVPVLDGYCSERYGEEWDAYKKEVRWTLIPGVY